MTPAALESRSLFPELSYAGSADDRLRRWMIRGMEKLAGRDRLAGLYQTWRSDVVPRGENLFSSMLDLVGIDLRVGGAWPPKALPEGPLVMVANHPFGIADGIAILSLAERLGRPFRVMIHSDLLRVPEIRPYALPIDFSESRQAVQGNLETRRQALELLAQGVTIVVFPAGGVSTAPKGFGAARDLDWKMFPARLVRDANASVLPIFFHGQNSVAFHLASRISMTLRLALLVPEFVRRCGRPVEVTVGDVLPAAELSVLGGRRALLDHLHAAVHKLSAEPLN